MKRFIRELRRREVFRTLGLYVGVSWILIQAADVVLPAFDAPDWALRALVIAAVAGFPIVAVLAWLYDISMQGISRDLGPTDTIIPVSGGRKADFVIIGVLVGALALSVYLNLTRGPESVEELEPVSVLIADFENSTGESIFDGLLEQALKIGIESAPHIATFDRNAAENLAKQLELSAHGLPVASARLLAAREGINMVLSGSIETSDGGFRLALRGLQPASGESTFDVSTTAAGRDAVLTAVGTLAEGVREALGDATLNQGDSAADTFTAVSIEAASAYTTAQKLQALGKNAEAIDYYTQAVELDPVFGRAYSGWALSAFKLGRTAEAAELWNKALEHMGTMTERERLRTLGVYYSAVTKNFPKAIEAYQELVKKYPADDRAHSNLAVLHFYALDFRSALAEGGKVLAVYPNVAVYRGNHALFAMYTGDFDTAVAEATQLLETDPGYFKAYLPIAMNALANNDLPAAQQAYQRMAETGGEGTAVASLGLADTAIFAGDFAKAREILESGIEADLDAGNQYVAAAKYMAIADAFLAEGNIGRALEAVEQTLAVSEREPWVISAALIYLDAGQIQPAEAIAKKLVNELRPQSRASGMMIRGLISSRQGRHVEAIETMTQALALADLWLLRFNLGKVYLDAGYKAESFDEFMQCKDRYGEATSLFLDDYPTYRYMTPLMYWLGAVQTELGMTSAAVDNLTKFLALRPNGGALVEAAKQKLP